MAADDPEHIEAAEGVERDNPQVTVSPGVFGNIWYLQVEGYNRRAKVERIE